jgi:hypothetical protein
MNKETTTGGANVNSDADHLKHGTAPNHSVGAASSAASVPRIQQESRSDQEQEGVQNPAGDTRDVSREPVHNPPGETQEG